MNSIRTRLLAWLLPAAVLGALLGAIVTYRNVLQELESQFDYQLRQMALSLRYQGYVSPEDAAAISDEKLDFVVQIWAMDGMRIYSTRTPAAFPVRAVLGFSDMNAGDTVWRVYSVTTGDRVIQVGQPRDIRRELAARAALRSVVPALVITPLLAVLIWWTVGRSLEPLKRVVSEVRQRDAQALEPLSDAGTPVEIAPLTQAINSLLQRVRASFLAQQSFIADAAHELRSPLTALKLQSGLLARASTETERGEALASLTDGIDRATRLVEQLLTLARNEPGATGPVREQVDVSDLARLAITDVLALANARSTEIALDAPAPAAAIGDPAALRILMRNLVDNAVRYTPAGGHVDVAVRFAASGTVLRIDDSGPGIPDDERERVFDRFYRRSTGDDSASSTGSGLGLAIVRTIAGRHGVAVSLDRSAQGGLGVCVKFPPNNCAPDEFRG